MKLYPIAALLLAGLAMPALAESQLDQVRCVVLSGIYAKSAPDEKGKQIARLTGAFYLGRIDPRADGKVLSEALRAESKTIDPKTSGPQMEACAARLAQAQALMNALGRMLAPAK